MSITIDKGHDELVYSPVCVFCVHLHDDKHRECDAFDQIPLAIWNGDNPHTSPYPGDRGIQFERRPDLAPGVGPAIKKASESFTLP